MNTGPFGSNLDRLKDKEQKLNEYEQKLGRRLSVLHPDDDIDDVPEFDAEYRVTLRPKGILESGNPKLFQPSRSIDGDEFSSDKIKEVISDLTVKLDAMPYIALAAPQVGLSYRLLVMHNDNQESSQVDEPIPYQVWINPVYSPEDDSQRELAWERYATDPGHEVLITHFSSIRVRGWCCRSQSPDFKYVDQRMTGWAARAIQALAYYFEGRLPSERAVHPAFIMPRDAYTADWESGGLTPFRIRRFPFEDRPTIEVSAGLRQQLDSLVPDVWLKSNVEPKAVIDILGFISVESGLTPENNVHGALSERLFDFFAHRTRFAESHTGSKALVRLFRLDMMESSSTPSMHSPTDSAQHQVVQAASTPHSGTTSVTDHSFDNPKSKRRSSTPPARTGGTGSAKLMPPNNPDDGSSSDNARTLPQEPTWRPYLDCYDYDDIRALTFATKEGINAAIDLLWTPSLRHAPHELADGMTVIVPAEAVSYFDAAGLEFTNYEVSSIGDLSPNERARLRREHGIL